MDNSGAASPGAASEQPRMLRAAGGVEKRERPLQARRHLGEDVA